MHGHKLVKRHWREGFFPTAMSMPADAFVRVADALNRGGKAENRRGHPKMLQAHELIIARAATIPGFATQVFKSGGSELDVGLEIGAADMADGSVKLLRSAQNIVEFFIRKFEPGHFSSK